MEIVTNRRPDPQAEDTSLMITMRTSLELEAVAWALAQADCIVQRRMRPVRINDLHHGERRKYEDAALLALMLVNRDAELYAEGEAADCAFAELVQYCKNNKLDWLDDDHPVNEGDGLELLMHQCAKKAVQRFRAVLHGTYPGLSQHLARLQKRRTEMGE